MSAAPMPAGPPAVSLTAPTDHGRALTNDDVVALAKAGLGDALIIAKIRAAPAAYDLDPDGLVFLKRNGLSDDVISAMLGRTK